MSTKDNQLDEMNELAQDFIQQNQENKRKFKQVENLLVSKTKDYDLLKVDLKHKEEKLDEKTTQLEESQELGKKQCEQIQDLEENNKRLRNEVLFKVSINL